MNRLKMLLKKRNQIKKKKTSYSKEYKAITALIHQERYKKEYRKRMEEYRLANMDYASFRVLKHTYLNKTSPKSKGYEKLISYITKKPKKRSKFLQKIV